MKRCPESSDHPDRQAEQSEVEQMERGIYFDGWYKHNYCYHPSMPLRSA